MAGESSYAVHLLCDHPELVWAVGEMRWSEWGRAPEPEELAWWVDVSGREAGRHELPVTFVAVNAVGEAVGAVGLGVFDIEERRDRSPWVLGMIVRAQSRGRGAGRLLLSRLERFAADLGYPEVWVATGPAAAFYQRCGWRSAETLRRQSGDPTTILNKRL